MASYYYLIASLPMLSADASPLAYDEFLRMCKTTVSAKTYDALLSLTVDSDTGPFCKAWSSFYSKLSAELTYHRNEARGKPADKPFDRDAEIAIKAVLAAPDPLKAEQMLLKMEFQHIDEIVGLHNFDDTYLFGYAMKLKLLERQRSFEFSAGKQEFVSLLSNIQQEIYSL